MRWLLIPISALYQSIVWFRNLLYDLNIFKSKEFDISVISVGNLAVGGTGKTPHSEYIVELLKDKFNIAILSRGYKRKTKGFRFVTTEDTYLEAGDEPKQISLKFPKLIIAVNSNRVEGVKKILKKHPETNVVLLDDAHQHRRITPSIRILLTEYDNLFYNDSFLPYGRLRDNISQYKRANTIIVTKCPEDLKPIERRIISQDLKLLPYQTIYFSYLKYGKLTHLTKNKKPKINNETQILLVTGIANPKPLVKYLKENISEKINHIKFPDHFSFNEKSIQKINAEFENMKTDNKIVITTEKDAVRLREKNELSDSVKANIYHIPIKIDFLFEARQEFNNQIINYVRKNKTNYDLHTTKNQF